MNKNERRLLKALELISDMDINKLKNFEKEMKMEYNSFLPKDVKKILLDNKYVSFNKKDLPDPSFPITKKGNDYKNELKKLKYEFLGSVLTKLNIAAIIINVIWFIFNIQK